ncbi:MULTISPECIES: membrane protein insertase YidC [Sphingomonas]|uniref:Membrane protein insertase YidC n=1 Tax=Sphingomonas hankookensis TaxID=563996 RepID=A0ABR5Y7W4_9SPHN|nr:MULTISPECIES: membrane protein insertase YidC [Sphingomonas]KZE08638.1 membrane protein insertase YidC [Sphingomonas hankookensis]PZT96694.1 MAG: membrane protein insertase YidC [Sphingomonas sp.]RSV30220.1 membrane protein insertase YidC [Sphingomonas sp. ABOLH]WCP71249.1 membrane protein insertase YidC [Sphingomonas hankookensis]
MKNDQKNFLLFAVLAALVLFGWPYIANHFFPAANPPVTKLEDGRSKPVANPATDPAADTANAIRDRAVVLRETPRVLIETPSVRGSINLRGGRIDDLVLVRHKETIAKDSPPVRLLSPSGTADAYFAQFGWSGTGITPPPADALWTASGAKLTPTTPVTLTTQAGSQRYLMQISVDNDYMFTVRQSIVNTGAQPVQVATYGLLSRRGSPVDKDTMTIQVGPIYEAGNGVKFDVDYKDIDAAPTTFNAKGGWLGFTDHYWMTALIPDQNAQHGLSLKGADQRHQADYRSPTLATLNPGQAMTQSARFFAGAKENKVLNAYEEQGVPYFSRSIDWGWFRVVEEPIFVYLDWLFRMVGNFGVAIILLTLTIRGLMFPIAQRQFASMAAMRAIQPKLKVLQERYKDDKPRLQQEMMALYKTEKVNPVAGCLPTLIQIPIFYALYKVLLLTIEMRHQPFVGWIKDLSAPDPATILNLFGYLDFTPPHFLAIGIVPVLLGISMYFQFKLNPAPMDDMQKQVFGLMPWVLMFIMAPFAVGLQVYWITSNLLTIAQQQLLYSRHPALKQAPAK